MQTSSASYTTAEQKQQPQSVGFHTANIKMPIQGDVVLKYFDLTEMGGLCGLGGSVRFLMLANGVKFTEEYASLAEWPNGLKAEAIKSGESITGHLPVLKVAGKNYIESNAICRYLSRQLGLYGADPEQDYVVDMTADVLADFRKAWFDAMRKVNPNAVDTYLTAAEKRKHYYQVLNTIIATNKGSGRCVIGNKPTFIDDVLFAMLWDDVAAFKGDEYLWVANPHVKAFFSGYLSQPHVKEWCTKMRPDMVEGIKSG